MNKIVVACLCLGLAVAPAWAAELPFRDYYQRRFHPNVVEVREVEGLRERLVNEKLYLTIRDFLTLVLRNSTDIHLTRLDVYTAADAITAAKAPFDPLLQLNFNALRTRAPQFNEINGGETLNSLSQTYLLNFQQLLPTGQTVTTQFNFNRSSTNSEFFFYNPYINGAMTFLFTQPLLRDRTNIQNKAPLQIARTQLVITSEQSEARIADLIAQAAGQYWDAVASRDTVRVQQQTVELAEKSYERDKKALELGALASLDIYQSQTQLAQRRLSLIQAQYAYKAAREALRRLIGADLTPDLRDAEIVLSDDPSSVPPESAVKPFEDSLALAMDRRPELSAANRRTSVDELNARVARNSLTPRLDLQLTGGSNSLGGNAVPSVGLIGLPPLNSIPFSDTLHQLFGFTYPTYGFGLVLNVPFRSSAASANLSDALVNKARDAYAARQIRQQITLEVRQSVDQIALARASMDTALQARNLATKNVEAEQQKYELGTITAFELLDSQNRLAEAESGVITAEIGYQKAHVNYQRATWALLDGLGAVIEKPKIR
jgi:outer membrane protein TolC